MTGAVDSVPQSSVAIVYPLDDTAGRRLHPLAGLGSHALQDAGRVRAGSRPQGPPSGVRQRSPRPCSRASRGVHTSQTPALRRTLRAQWRGWGAQTFIMGPGRDETAARAFVTWVIGKPPSPPTGSTSGTTCSARSPRPDGHAHSGGRAPVGAPRRRARIRRSAAPTRRLPLSRRTTWASATDRMAPYRGSAARAATCDSRASTLVAALACSWRRLRVRSRSTARRGP